MIAFLVFFATAIYLLYYLTTKNYDYWKKRNVPHLKPVPFFGNFKDYVLLRKYGSEIAREICQQFPNEPYVGTYYGTEPALVIKDPDILRLILVKDFYYFSYREVESYTHKEPITRNMFFSGGDRWRILRHNLSPLFSSSKLKNMFYLINNCTEVLEKNLKEEIKEPKVIEAKKMLANYTMDCIVSCAFGINAGTQEKSERKNDFTIMGEKLFDVSIFGGLKLVGRAMWPSIFYSLGLRLFSDKIDKFFTSILTNVFESRQYKATSRNDFVDLVMGWKKNEYLIGDSMNNMMSDNNKLVKLDVNDNLLLGQCVMFFAAGFETTSTTSTFILYELAKNNAAQERVIEEVDEYFKKNNGKIEYQCINEMPYLIACMEEALRLYPVLSLLTREVVADYVLPTGLRLEKGMRIHIPMLYLHRNPDVFPDPDVFKPERFFGDERKNIKQFTYMPFGEGPRICLGMRFARMPLISALLTIFKNYRVELADDMPKTVSFNPRALVTQPWCDIRLKFIPRKDVSL